MFIYPDNLRAKAKLWELKNIAVIGIGKAGEDAGYLKQLEKRVRDCGFHVRMADEQDLKRLLTVGTLTSSDRKEHNSQYCRPAHCRMNKRQII